MGQMCSWLCWHHVDAVLGVVNDSFGSRGTRSGFRIDIIAYNVSKINPFFETRLTSRNVIDRSASTCACSEFFGISRERAPTLYKVILSFKMLLLLTPIDFRHSGVLFNGSIVLIAAGCVTCDSHRYSS